MAGGSIKELITRFGFEIDDKGLKQLEEGIDAVKEGVLHLGELLVGEAVGLYELVERSSQSAVQLAIMSQETGVAAGKLQELQFRANLAEMSTDELNQSMYILARNLESARKGSEDTRKAFHEVGISTAEIRAGTVTADIALERIGKRFEHMENGVRKAGLASDFFGRSGARMIPFLNQLSEELDPVNRKLFEMSKITDDEIERSREFDDQLKTLKTGLLGVARVVGFGMIPAATEIVQKMKLWIVQNRELLIQDLTGFVKGMAAALALTLKIVDALVQSFAGFANSIGGVETATKFLLGTMAVLSGATVLFGIGKLVQAVVTLGNAFAIANLKAAAIPIAIGAAMVSVFLIIEDIYSFFAGKKSFTGDLLEKLSQLGKAIKPLFDPILEPLITLIKAITGGFGNWKIAIGELGALIVNVILTPFRLVGNVLGLLVDGIGKLTGSTAIRGFADDIYKAADANRIGNPFLPTAAVTPSVAVGSAAGGSNRQTNQNLAVTNQFNFPPGTEPTKVADKISSSVSDGLLDVLRATSRSTADGGAY